MPLFIANKNSQLDGCHEESETCCNHLPDTWNQNDLGWHSNWHLVVTEVKRFMINRPKTTLRFIKINHWKNLHCNLAINTIAIIGILIFCMQSCKLSPNSNSEIPIFDLAQGFTGQQLPNLSKIGNQIEYVVFEENPKYYLGKIKLHHITKNYIYVKDAEQDEIICFERNGKFYSILANYGRGPEEYVEVLDFSGPIDSDNLFILHDLGKISEYSPEGVCVKTISSNYPAWRLSFIKDDPVIYIPRVFSSECNGIQIVKYVVETGKEEIIHSVPMDRTFDYALIPPFTFDSYRGGIILWEMFSDTILFFDDKGKKSLLYGLKRHKSYVPRNNLTTNAEFHKSLSKYDFIAVLINDLNFIFMYGDTPKFRKSILIDKQTETTFGESNSGKKFKNGLLNDIDGGVSFWPQGVSNDNLYYSFIRPKEFALSKNESDSSKFQFSYSEKYLRFIERISEIDNCVLMLVNKHNEETD